MGRKKWEWDDGGMDMTRDGRARKGIAIVLIAIQLTALFIGVAVSSRSDAVTENDWAYVMHSANGDASTDAPLVEKRDVMWSMDYWLTFQDVLVVGDELYVRDFGNEVFALELQTGAVRWTYKMPLLTGVAFARDWFVGDKCVYLPFNRTDLTFENHTLGVTALDRATGAKCFELTFPVNEIIGGPVMTSRGLVIINRTAVRIYDKTNGALLETQPLPKEAFEFTQTTANDLIFFQDQGDNLTAYDITKKSVAWTADVGLIYGWPFPVISSNGRVYVSSWPGVVAIDITDGSVDWESDALNINGYDVSANDDWVVISRYNEIIVLDADTGSEAWSVDVDFWGINNTYTGDMSPATICGDVLLITSSDRFDRAGNKFNYTNLTAFDIRTGKELWTHTFPVVSAFFEPPVVVPGAILLITTKGLYALGERWAVPELKSRLVKDPDIFSNGNITVRNYKEIQFAAPNITGIDTAAAKYKWDFGDGDTSTDKDPVHTYKKNGEYTVTVTVTSGPRSVVVENYATVRPGGSRLEPPLPVVPIAASVLVTVIVITVVAVSLTEVGICKLMPAFFALYSRMKKVEALDHYQRGRIMGYLQANPGEHYTSIKEELGIQNGVLAYHLQVLEREGYIRSKRDGMLKRFYPAGAKVPEPVSVEEQIIAAIRRNPGISQVEVAEKTGIPPSTVHRVLHSQESAGTVTLVRDGKHVRCHLVKEIELQDGNKAEI